MDQQERLALAVRAHVARIRAEQAGARAAFLERAVQPDEVGLGRFRGLYGREPDLQRPGDQATLLSLAEYALAGAGAGGITREMLSSAQAALRERARCLEEADAATGAVVDAMRAAETGGTTTILEWIGCDAETFGRAVVEALADTAEQD